MYVCVSVYNMYVCSMLICPIHCFFVLCESGPCYRHAILSEKKPSIISGVQKVCDGPIIWDGSLPHTSHLSRYTLVIFIRFPAFRC